MTIEQHLLDRGDLQHMLEVRRAIHAEPELSHQEIKTRALVLSELDRAGLFQRKFVGPTGFCVDIVGKGGGRSVGIRADMDALPIQETCELPFASKRTGVMHACGHDSHTAMVLESALWLSRNTHLFNGRVRFFFQHSEESLPSGAQQFVESGLVDDIDIVLGIHVDPLLGAGLIAAAPGPFACSSDHFDVVISGRSAHGGRPHEGADAIASAVTFLAELNKVSAHSANPMVPLVVTAGMISGGTAHNVIADRVTIGGTVRAGDADVRAVAHRRLREIATGISAMHATVVEVAITEDAPLLINDPSVARLLQASAAKAAGAAAVSPNAPMWSASDDFAYFSNLKPGTYFRLGVRNEHKGFVHPLHHPRFAIDEDALAIGAAVLIQATLDVLSV